MEVLNPVVKFLFSIGCHELSLKGNNEGGISLNRGMFFLGLLSEDSLVFPAHLNDILGSAFKLTFPEI